MVFSIGLLVFEDGDRKDAIQIKIEEKMYKKDKRNKKKQIEKEKEKKRDKE